MSNLLAKRYNNNQVKVEANANKGKNLAGKQKVANQKESAKQAELEHIKVMKEVKVLPLDLY